MEFDIKLEPKDMYRFNLYQTYTGFQGWLSIFLAIFLFFAAGATAGTIETTYTILYAAFGGVFLVYLPISLWLRSKKALVSSDVLKGTLHYFVDEKGFQVSQGEKSALLSWEQIYKMTATKHNVLVYSGRINAYVIPKEQLGSHYEQLAQLANKKLPKYRVKMRQK